MVYEKRDTEEIRSALVETLEANIDEPATRDTDVLGALATMVAETLSEQQEASLEEVSQQAYLLTATGEELTLKAAERGILRREATPATGVLSFTRQSPAPDDFVIPAGTRAQTTDGSVQFETVETVALSQDTTEVQATARASLGGRQGNLPANKLTVLPSPPTGIENVTNPSRTGDSSLSDTSGNALVVGNDVETDEELRDRTLESLSFGGSATPSAIEASLLGLDNVSSVTLFTNATGTTDSQGLPPFSNEIVVSGGSPNEIANALANTMAVTDLLRLQSGIVANGDTVSLFINAIEQTVDIKFSRPTDVPLSVDVTVDTDASYIGNDSLADELVTYTNTRGTGEDVFISQLIDTIVGDDTGVRAIAGLTVDTTGDGTDDRVTNSDGIEAIPVSNSEVSSLDAADVTVTQV